MRIRSLIALTRSTLAGLAVASLFLIGCGGSQTTSKQSADPSVVAVFDGEALTLPEFEARYARSIGGETLAAEDSLQEYQDFLERYVNFRLKVKAAEDAGYRSSTSIQQEIEEYRTSFAKPYLLDKEIINPIVEQLYDRSKTIVDASHILLPVGANVAPADTQAVYAKMQVIVDSLSQGASFAELAFNNSQDPSARRLQDNGQPGIGYQGRLGWFSAGRMVAPFEDAAFETPVGEASGIFRTQFGYHVLYVHDKQDAVPDVGLAHIMIRPATPTPEDSSRALALTQAIQDSLAQGVDFADLARRYSDDQRSGAQGGNLGFLAFDDARVDATFKEAAFALENVGDVSDIVSTPFGYHLIKLTERKQLGTLEEQYDALKTQASRLPRTQAAEQQLAREARETRGTTLDTTLVMGLFESLSPDSVVQSLTDARFSDETLNSAFATIGDSVYTVRDWHEAAKQSRFQKGNTGAEQALIMANSFLNAQALDYEATALEQRDDEFRTIMQEFRDGLLLFKLMEDSVWTAASQDSMALEAYFGQNAAAYSFPERTKILSLSSPIDSLLRATVARLDANLSFEALRTEIAENSLNLRLDTLLLEGPTTAPYAMALNLEEGAHTPVLMDQNRATVFFRREQLPARPKTFEEARPQVVTDYQRVLEENLIDHLRGKYNVRTFPERLSRAFTPAGATTTTASGE